MTYEDIMKQLGFMADSKSRAGMARFGINPEKALGISIPDLLLVAKQVGKDHGLARELWDSQIHEARILACMIDEPGQVTENQMEAWVLDFNSWDLCDQCCNRLFRKTRFARDKAIHWSERPEEFVKRAGFVLMTQLAVHDKAAEDDAFERFFPIIQREAGDDRNFVKKAVNWALRQIGKRNRRLNGMAVEYAKAIGEIDAKSAHWIAADALRELTSEKVRKRLK